MIDLTRSVTWFTFQQVRGNGNVSDGKSMTVYKNPQTSRVDVPGDMSGLDATFSVESDINIEKADACAKGLEDVSTSLIPLSCFYYDEICICKVDLVGYLFSSGLLN